MTGGFITVEGQGDVSGVVESLSEYLLEIAEPYEVCSIHCSSDDNDRTRLLRHLARLWAFRTEIIDSRDANVYVIWKGPYIAGVQCKLEPHLIGWSSACASGLARPDVIVYVCAEEEDSDFVKGLLKAHHNGAKHVLIKSGAKFTPSMVFED